MLIRKSAIPTDLKSLKVKIGGKDVTSYVNQAIVFQDVFTPTWTCQIQMNDADNMIMNIPIKAGAPIIVEAETSLDSVMDGKKQFQFVVSHISDKVLIKQEHSTYLVHGVSKVFFINQGTRISRGWIDEKPNVIIQEILGEIDANCNTHTSDNKITTIIPNLSPFTAAQKVAKVATCDGVSDFLIFQTDNTQWVAKSFEKLYNSENSGFRFKMRPFDMRDEAGNLQEDYCTCFHQYKFEHHDAMSAQAAGMYASKKVSFDYISKSWSVEEFKYGDDVEADSQGKSWDKSLEMPDAHTMYIPSHPGLHEKPTELDYASEWLSSRKSNMMKIDQDRLTIQLPAGVKGWKGIGKYCHIEMPGEQAIKKTKRDEFYDGKYLIIAISHIFSPGSASFTNYELTKKRLKRTM